MPIPSGVDQKKSKVYVQKSGGDYIQILPESFCESEILEGSMWPVSSHALKQYSNSIEERIAPFAGATANRVGKIGTVPEAKSSERTYFLRGDGKWAQIIITDEKVKAIKDASKKFYLTGTDINDTNVNFSYFDSGVYVSANAGELCATKFKGNLEGNVKGNLEGTASKAIADANGNNIVNTYATKTLVSNTYAPLSHTHQSTDINALNGYSKGNSTTAIASSDTLNQALGKLEKRADLAASLDSPAFTGTPTVPNLSSNSNDRQIANKKYVDDKISGVIGGASSSFDTLKELANAIGNDASFATTVDNKLATKLDKNSSGYIKTLSISDNTAGSGQILKVQRGDDTNFTLPIKDTTYTPAAAAPLAPASTAKVGTSVKYAREDHVHPLQTTISGKAGSADSADKLTTARQLRANLAATAVATFDGTANQLNIPVAGVLPVANGGTGASNLNGLVQTGNVNQTIGGTKTFSNTIAGSINGNAATAATASKTHGASAGTSWVAGAQAGKSIVNSTATGYGTVFNAPTKDYRVALGTYPSNDNLVYFYSVTNANINAGTNTKAKQLTWNAETGELTANSFKGNISGSSTSCSGNAATASRLGTTTVGGTANPIYLNNGTATAISATVGSASKPVFLNAGTIAACSATVGSGIKPVYLNAGTIAASGSNVGADIKPIYMAGGTLTASNANVGSKVKPIYMAGGTLTASDSTIGSKTKPVYLNAGTITASDGAAGGTTQPIYMTGGTLTATTANIGANNKPIYMAGGKLTASTANVGNASTPVYVSGGTLTACSGISAKNDGSGNQITTTYLKLSGGTVTGTLDLTRTTDAQGTGTAAPALRIGALSGAHLEFDGNEIMAKASSNTVGTLYINSDGGQVVIGSGGLKVNGTITGNISGSSTSCSGNAATATKATTLATARNFYIADNSSTNTGPATSFNGSANATIKLPATIKANITGNCSGNAATATKLGTATVGSTTKPIYLNAGAPTASNANVGGAQQLTYLKAGVITAGATIRYGTGNPSNSTGSNGDVYFKYLN